MRTHANTHELHNAHMHTDSLATFAHHIYIKSIHIHIEYFAVCAHTFVHIRTHTFAYTRIHKAIIHLLRTHIQREYFALHARTYLNTLCMHKINREHTCAHIHTHIPNMFAYAATTLTFAHARKHAHTDRIIIVMQTP